MTGKQLKNSILQWAIQGKLVPQDPNDEPASVLLEKIRAEKARLVKEGKIKKDKKESIIYRGDDNSYYEKFADGTTVCIDDEIPFDVPKGWEWCRLNDIATIVGGYAYKSYDFLSSSPYQVLRLGNIKNDFLKLDASPVYISDDLAIKTDKFRCHLDDILITMTGTRKKRDYFFSYKVESINQNCFINQRVGAIRFYIKEISNYMIHALKAESILQDVFQYETGTANQGNLGNENIAKVLIPLPPFAEQHRIVDKIKKLLPIIEQYDSAQSKLDSLNSNINELLKKSILQEAIQGKLVPQDQNDEPASALLQRIREEKAQLLKEGKLKKKDIVDSVIFKGEDNKYYEQIGDEVVDITEDIPFEIPDSWEWIRFGNLVKMNIGKTPPRGDSQYWSNGVYPWVSISDMNDYGLIGSTKERISLLASEKIMGEISAVGTLLMSFKLTVGRTSILNIEAFHNEAIISIYPYVDKDFAIRDYLFYSLPLIANLGESKDAIKGKTLNSKSLFNLPIPLSPIDEQKRIVYKIRELYAQL